MIKSEEAIVKGPIPLLLQHRELHNCHSHRRAVLMKMMTTATWGFGAVTSNLGGFLFGSQHPDRYPVLRAIDVPLIRGKSR
jgi:hypothetical protein